MKRLVIGDIHGNYKGMLAALEKANFIPEEDELYGVGDYVDGHSQTKEVIDYLKSLPKFRGVIGNHDQWLIEWFDNGSIESPNIWYNQGGKATLQSYGVSFTPSISGMLTSGEIPDSHKKWFRELEPFIEIDDMCIVHGGWVNTKMKVTELVTEGKLYIKELFWNRNFWYYAYNHKTPPYDKVFIGHTASNTNPEKRKNIWNLDSGGGWKGKITVMNMDNEEYWQSESAIMYYPDFSRVR
jgi:serine/threonine protein phosphatase 1